MEEPIVNETEFLPANPTDQEGKVEGGPINPYGQGSSLVSYIKDNFEMFQNARRPFEEIWRECLLNYLGQYQQELVWKKETEGRDGRSQVFVKLTTLKCNTAHSKIVDAMFTGKPDVPFDLMPVETQMLQKIPADALAEIVRKAKDRLKEYFRMIELEETLDEGILEGAIFGSIILKAPIVVSQRKPVLRERTMGGVPATDLSQGAAPAPFSVEYEDTLLAVVDSVPIWEYYTDPNAKTPAESIGEIHFKRMLPADFQAFARTPGYDREAVMEASRWATKADKADLRYEQLGEKYMGEMGVKDDRISVVEWWGKVQVMMLRENGVEVSEALDAEEWVEAVVTLACDGLVIRAEVNALPRRPFFVCPIKKRPRTIWGIGYAELMRDSQKIVNSAARLFIDNKALSGNGMVAVNLDRINLKRTKNLKIYPGKTWYLKGQFSPRVPW